VFDCASPTHTFSGNCQVVPGAARDQPARLCEAHRRRVLLAGEELPAMYVDGIQQLQEHRRRLRKAWAEAIQIEGHLSRPAEVAMHCSDQWTSHGILVCIAGAASWHWSNRVASGLLFYSDRFCTLQQPQTEWLRQHKPRISLAHVPPLSQRCRGRQGPANPSILFYILTQELMWRELV
jgi:hypothetical protein